ncbi:hypothetical protein UlMin_031781 [Ulmus minor]
MTTILGRIWGVDTGWSPKILDQKNSNCYIALSFKDKEMFYWVVEKRPWLLNGGLLLVDNWPVTGEWENARLNSYSCWGKEIRIPLKLLSDKNIGKIVSSAGEALEINFDLAKALFWRNFVRFKVEINVDKSVCPGRFVSGDGKEKWVQFKYEKLSFMCFKCGLIRHEKTNCEKPLLTVANADGMDILVYGIWMKMENPVKDCFEAARLLKEGHGKKPWQGRYMNDASRPAKSGTSSIRNS